jgi:hypothetical protein
MSRSAKAGPAHDPGQATAPGLGKSFVIPAGCRTDVALAGAPRSAAMSKPQGRSRPRKQGP